MQLALFMFHIDIQFGLYLLNVSFAFNVEKQNKRTGPLKRSTQHKTDFRWWLILVQAIKHLGSIFYWTAY